MEIKTEMFILKFILVSLVIDSKILRERNEKIQELKGGLTVTRILENDEENPTVRVTFSRTAFKLFTMQSSLPGFYHHFSAKLKGPYVFSTNQNISFLHASFCVFLFFHSAPNPFLSLK